MSQLYSKLVINHNTDRYIRIPKPIIKNKLNQRSKSWEGDLVSYNSCQACRATYRTLLFSVFSTFQDHCCPPLPIWMHEVIQSQCDRVYPHTRKDIAGLQFLFSFGASRGNRKLPRYWIFHSVLNSFDKSIAIISSHVVHIRRRKEGERAMLSLPFGFVRGILVIPLHSSVIWCGLLDKICQPTSSIGLIKGTPRQSASYGVGELSTVGQFRYSNSLRKRWRTRVAFQHR